MLLFGAWNNPIPRPNSARRDETSIKSEDDDIKLSDRIDRLEIPTPVELRIYEFVLSDNQPLIGATTDIISGTARNIMPTSCGEYPSSLSRKKGIKNMTLNMAVKLISALILAAANGLFLKCRNSIIGCLALVSTIMKIIKDAADRIKSRIMYLDPHPSF